MYRYSDRQISLTDFQQSLGMKLREDNRWVKKAQIISWGKLEGRYAALFPSKTENVAKPLRLALGALIIQQEYSYSDEELTLQIQENPYLQYFCGYLCFDDSKTTRMNVKESQQSEDSVGQNGNAEWAWSQQNYKRPPNTSLPC